MSNEEGDYHRKPYVFFLFGAVLLFGLGLLIARLFSLTVIEGENYRKLAINNRLREVRILAPRGIIYDRNGLPLVRNIPLEDYGKENTDESTPDNENLLVEGVTREYIYKDVFSHILGYIGEINNDEISLFNQKLTIQNKGKSIENPYKMKDMVGKNGIELFYDNYLRGKDGKKLYEVDAFEQQVRVLGRFEPQPGKNLYLTIDTGLQSKAKEIMTGKKGALIVSNPNTGEILSLISEPGFDPNIFITGNGIDEIFVREDNPLFNRAISGLYPPGSTFKIITALAALESDAIDKNTKIEDTGVLKVGDFSFGNWYFSQYGKTDGFVDMITALKRSNDIYFYKVAEKTGIETIAEYAKKMGLGSDINIDLPGFEKGLMPDPIWRKEVLGQNWFLGNTYHIAIGQGDIQATPLHVNTWTNLIATDGIFCTPHLDKNKNDLKSCRILEFKRENIETVKKGMIAACEDGGTGWPLFNFHVENDNLKIDELDFFPAKESTRSAKKSVRIPIACKTGTAEFGNLKKTHAWFTAFAPVFKPEISVTVLVEEGGEGSSVAAPLAKEIFKYWFTKEIIDPIQADNI